VQYAAAGLSRGKIDGKAVEYSCDQADLETLYLDPNCINPIADMATGLVIWGNKTLLRGPGPLKFMNIRRMVTYAEKAIATAAKYLNFDPNNETTWTALRVMVNPFLAELAKNNGLEAFYVVCDAGTNPPEKRAQGVMTCDLHLVPTPPAEAIVFNFNIYESGAEFAE
jgi:phage tail sheath protein FI